MRVENLATGGDWQQQGSALSCLLRQKKVTSPSYSGFQAAVDTPEIIIIIIRPVGGRLAEEACAHTYIYIYTHDTTVVYVDS